MATLSVDAIEFRVIGEHRFDRGHLLLIGDDGKYYRYALDNNDVEPAEFDESWRLDPTVPGDLRVVVPMPELEQ